MNLRGNSIGTDGRRRRTTTHFKSFLSYKPRGASPGRDNEDGISTKNLVLNILWCRVGNYIKKGGECSAGYGLIERF